MGWPKLELSAPTTASHSLDSGPATEDHHRQFKRRKLVQEQAVSSMEMDTLMPMSSSTMATTFAPRSIVLRPPPEEANVDTDVELESTSNSSTASFATATRPITQNGGTWADEELVYQVLESGAETQAEVIQFCCSQGVPVSRVLQMDLVRRLSYLRTGC